MNIARCSIKKAPPHTGWCVRMTSMSIGISKMMLLEHSLTSNSECRGKSSDSFNLKKKEIMNDDRSSSSSTRVDSQRCTIIKIESLYSKLYIFLSSFLSLHIFNAMFSSFLTAIYFVFGNQVVDRGKKSEVLCAVTPNSTENGRIFPDMTGNEVSKEVQIIRKQLSYGYYLRCKAFLLACRPQLAKQVWQYTKMINDIIFSLSVRKFFSFKKLFTIFIC